MRPSALAVACLLLYRDGADAQQTRAELLAALRAQKAEDIAEGRLPPEGSDTLERVSLFIEEGPILHWFAPDYAGFHPIIGDLQTGSGLALGLGYRYPFIESDGFFRASANLSVNVYRRAMVELVLPTFGGVSVSMRARHRNYPQVLFFGLGSDTRFEDLTSYRLVDQGLQLEAHYVVRDWLHAGARFSALDTEIGSGTREDWPSTDEVFDEVTAPGIEAQPRFHVGDVFVEVDYRDVPANARKGGHYVLTLQRFDDRELDRYDFDRLDLEATQLLPFFDKRRVLVLHARMVHAEPHPGSEVPFYLLPYIGGSDSLRGYHEFRFQDRNVLLFNVEHRWEAFAGLDMALFFDAGKVASELGQIRFGDLRTSYGIGFRFSTRQNLAFRLDIGTGGGEGGRVFFKFDHAF